MVYSRQFVLAYYINLYGEQATGAREHSRKFETRDHLLSHAPPKQPGGEIIFYYAHQITDLTLSYSAPQSS